MSDIQPADPEARRWTIILILVMNLLFLPLIWWLNANVASFENWIAHPEEGVGHAKLAIVVLIACGVLLFLAVASYINKLANSILSAERYPLLNKKVIKNAQIRRGEAARRIGKILKGYVIVVLLLVATLIIGGWKIIQAFDGIAIKGSDPLLKIKLI